MGRCKVKIEKITVQIYSFLVGPVNGKTLLGMPDMETLDILNLTVTQLI